MLFGEKGRMISLFAAIHAQSGLPGNGVQGAKSQLPGNHNAGLARAGIEPYPKAGRTVV
jgi:hypothetical protein